MESKRFTREMAWDEGLLRSINSGPESLTPAMRFLSGALDETPGRIGLLVILAVLLFRADGRRGVIQSLIAFPIANEITDLFKAYLPEPRPFQVHDWVILRVGASDSMGTASAHSANMAAVATVMCLRMGKWGIPWAVLAFLVGYSRAFNGAHYPHQVLLGWLVGIGTGFLVVKAWDFIVSRRKNVTVPEENAA